jgi:hypothetical protein
VEESFDHAMNNALDYTTNYTFDLAGNRLRKAVDKESDSDIDEETTYLYDAADRLLEENFDAEYDDRRTVYSWVTNSSATYQTSKTVTTSYDGSAPSPVETTNFATTCVAASQALRLRGARARLGSVIARGAKISFSSLQKKLRELHQSVWQTSLRVHHRIRNLVPYVVASPGHDLSQQIRFPTELA